MHMKQHSKIWISHTQESVTCGLVLQEQMAGQLLPS